MPVAFCLANTTSRYRYLPANMFSRSWSKDTWDDATTTSTSILSSMSLYEHPSLACGVLIDFYFTTLVRKKSMWALHILHLHANLAPDDRLLRGNFECVGNVNSSNSEPMQFRTYPESWMEKGLKKKVQYQYSNSLTIKSESQFRVEQFAM